MENGKKKYEENESPESETTESLVPPMVSRIWDYMDPSRLPFYICANKIVTAACAMPPTPSDHINGDITARTQELDQKLIQVAREKSREIDTYLSECKREEMNVMKILLLGGPACGKSTIFKQMRIIHQNGFKDRQQLDFYADLINRNVKEIFKQLVEGASHLRISVVSIQHIIEACNNILPEFNDQTALTGYRMTRQMGILLKKFWESDCIQKVYKQRHSISLLDSTKFFMEQILRICSPDFHPNDTDIVHSRHPTYTITSTSFTYNGAVLRLIDVGGQQSQRRKWIHLFDDARVVLFIVDLTVYVRNYDDDPDVSSMQETIQLFHDVATTKLLRRSLFLLFLNKIDLFEELLSTVTFRTCFNDYTDDDTVSSTISFLRKRFLDAARPRRSVFPHCTTATNTENVKVVFQACMESVFKQSTRATGLT